MSDTWPTPNGWRTWADGAWDRVSGVVTWSDELYRVLDPGPDAIAPSYEAFVDLGGHTVARFGGNKFMVLARACATRTSCPPCAVESPTCCSRPSRWTPARRLVTASIGVGLASPGETDLEKLIVQAEAAVRLAKEQGGGAHVVFGDDMHAADTKRDETEGALRRALADDEFLLHYQPKVALDSDRIVGAEALLRWQHPQRGMEAPLDFIPLAEETGLIVPIGAWVIGEACREAARWRRAFPDRPLPQVSVNVSARQFGPGLVDVVISALSTSGAEPGALCLEVTESVLMDDVGEAVTILRTVAGLGVALSIDDFGTGYSSLAQLKHLPLHELKIDKSFVDGLGRDPSDTAIVAALIAMAQALGLSVVAEGVETAEQLERLRTLGCEQAQGYFFARPQTPVAIHALLQLGAAWRSEGAHEPRPEGPSPNHRPERILVVDDEEETRQLARMSLSAVGFEVHEAADGLSAMATARRVAPSCVLLDLVLPDIRGAELCRALRAEPATARSTLLMLTSSDGAADKVEAFSSGADDYITKPFSPRNLTGRVNAAMRRRQEAAEPGMQRADNSDGGWNGAPRPAAAPAEVAK